MRKEYSHKTFIYAPLDITIFANTYETQYNWGHHVKIKDTDYHTLVEAKITYYNRTWETYGYQSTILKAIGDLCDYRKQELLQAYREHTNKTRLTALTKQHIYDNDTLLQQYIKMYDYFRDKRS